MYHSFSNKGAGPENEVNSKGALGKTGNVHLYKRKKKGT